ncbi:hypothetical protein AB0929_29810 [Streptomyces massasporeus]|uniref:hypothetical protein n=1 Tax=Streptomyces massasporeus TaxID=67324 RepID=UPI0034539C46
MDGTPAGEPVPDPRAALRQTLPPYMILAHLTAVPAIPLTPNGKTDREAVKRLLTIV